MGERGDPFAPIGAPLVEKCFHEQAPRVAEYGDQQEDAHAHAGNLQPLLAEINLELIAGYRFHAYRRELGDALLTPDVDHRALKRANADGEPPLAQEPLDDDRIAGAGPS